MFKSTLIRRSFFFLSAIIIGIAIAIYRMVDFNEDEATVVNGVWKANREMDLGNDKLLTARVAIAALFALKPSEVIYMIADKDSEGKLLSGNHDYIISGNPIDSRYWSITLYGTDYFLVPNPANRFSFNMANVQYNPDSTFQIAVSKKQKQKNWLPCGDEDNFYLLLRLYQPSPAIYQHLETVQLPDIQKVKE